VGPGQVRGRYSAVGAGCGLRLDAPPTKERFSECTHGSVMPTREGKREVRVAHES